MRAEDIDATGKIGNRPRHPQDAMHRSRRQLQQVDGVFQHRLIVRREAAHGIGAGLIEMRVAASGALYLYFARADDACTHDLAGFAGRRIGTQFRGRQSRDFDVQVDAFEQRA